MILLEAGYPLFRGKRLSLSVCVVPASFRQPSAVSSMDQIRWSDGQTVR